MNELIDIAINSKGEALAMGMAYENRGQQLFTVSVSHGKPLSNRLFGNDELVWGRALTSGADDNFVLVGTTSNENIFVLNFSSIYSVRFLGSSWHQCCAAQPIA